MRLITTPSNHTLCYECHKPSRYTVDIGYMDADGHIDQESGAILCADCLRAALETIAAAVADSARPEVQL